MKQDVKDVAVKKLNVKNQVRLLLRIRFFTNVISVVTFGGYGKINNMKTRTPDNDAFDAMADGKMVTTAIVWYEGGEIMEVPNLILTYQGLRENEVPGFIWFNGNEKFKLRFYSNLHTMEWLGATVAPRKKSARKGD